MGSDAATANTPAPAVSKDVGGKKKKANRSAKLKQCKLDARREQWLSQVKNKACKVVNMQALPPSTSHLPLTFHRVGKPNVPAGGQSSEMTPRREENGRTMGFHDADLHCRASSLASGVSGNGSARKDCLASSIRGAPYLRNTSDAVVDEKDVIKVEGRGEGGLDDWEAVADALTTRASGRCPQNPKHTTAVHELAGSTVPRSGDGILGKPEPDRSIPRAWRPDDVFRPRSLPKQRNFSLNSQWCCGQGTMSWAHRGIISEPSACPICYEDLDLTDSSFLPCSCGFHLCLFCHKKILEADGRCPGCRKQYSPLGSVGMGENGGGVPLLSLQMSHPYSMSSRP